MTTFGYNGYVACVPFEKRAVAVTIRDGVATIDQKVSLTPLRVICGNGKDIGAGDTVWVKPDRAKTWGKDEFEVHGQRIVLCPPGDVMLVTRAPPVLPPPTRSPGNGG